MPPLLNRLTFFFASSALCLAGLITAGCRHMPIDEGVGTAEALPINSFQVKWDAPLETTHGQITKLFLRDTLVIGYTEDGTAYVIDRATGAIQHVETIRHGQEVLHPPVVLKDLIVYPTNTSLEVYDRKRGDRVRSKDVHYAIRSDAVGSKNYLYYGADFIGGDRLVAVDMTNEYLDHRWTLMFPGTTVTAAPALLGDIVYVAAEDGKVTAIAYDTREPVWPLTDGVFKTHGANVADLVADESGVYVASTDSTLTVLNRNSGKVKWQYYAGAPLRDAPVVTRDLVFLNVPDVGAVVFDKINGAYIRAPRWIAPDIARLLAEDEKYVYIVRRGDGEVMALDKTIGKAVFSIKRHDLVAFATNPKDNVIFAVTNANRVMAIVSVLKPGTVGEIACAPAVSQAAPKRVAMAK